MVSRLEVILRENLVGVDTLNGHAFTGGFLHNLFSLDVWPVGR